MNVQPTTTVSVRLALRRMGQAACLLAVAIMAMSSTGCSWFRKGDKKEKGAMENPADYKDATGDDKPLPTPADDVPDNPKPVGLRDSPLDVIYFDFDRAEIRADQLESLERNVKYLKENTKEKVLIVGHCDERGTTEYNFALGDRRANAIQTYYVNAGIPADRIQVLSKGEEEPAESGHSESAWSKNRRCEFKFFD